MNIHPTIILAITILFASCSQKEVADTPVEDATESTYPLTTCVVSGQVLGALNEPVVVAHEGITVKLCCIYCADKFHADPAKYAKKVTDAEKVANSKEASL